MMNKTNNVTLHGFIIPHIVKVWGVGFDTWDDKEWSFYIDTTDKKSRRMEYYTEEEANKEHDELISAIENWYKK